MVILTNTMRQFNFVVKQIHTKESIIKSMIKSGYLFNWAGSHPWRIITSLTEGNSAIYIAFCSIAATHRGPVTHICVSNLTIIGPDNGLSPDRCQAIIWTNAGILLIGPLGTNFSQWNSNRNSYIFIQENPFNIMSFGKWRPFCFGLNMFSVILNPNSCCDHYSDDTWASCRVNRLFVQTSFG